MSATTVSSGIASELGQYSEAVQSEIIETAQQQMLSEVLISLDQLMKESDLSQNAPITYTLPEPTEVNDNRYN